MLLKNPPVSPGVESPIVKIHWWPRRLLSRMARNSFRRAANQNSGSEYSRKETNVDVWSRREYCRTAETTPTMTASTTATTMASDTRRAGTSTGIEMRIRRKVNRRTSVATPPSPGAGHDRPPEGGRPCCLSSLLLCERPLVHAVGRTHAGDVVDHVLVLVLVDEQGGLLEERQ